MKSCFFIGHREASSEILPALHNAVEQHIVEYGVTEFIVGHYGGFDRMAAKAVIDAKAQHPEITMSMVTHLFCLLQMQSVRVNRRSLIVG